MTRSSPHCGTGVGHGAGPVSHALAVIRKRLIAGALTTTHANDATEDPVDVPLSLFPSAPLLRRAWALRDNVTVYDACYVALAEALDQPPSASHEVLVQAHRLDIAMGVAPPEDRSTQVRPCAVCPSLAVPPGCLLAVQEAAGVSFRRGRGMWLQHPADLGGLVTDRRYVDEDDRTVVFEERRRGGGGRVLLVLVLIAALAVAAFFILGGSADVDTKGNLEVPEVDVDVNAPDVDVTSSDAPPASADAGTDDTTASNG